MTWGGIAEGKGRSARVWPERRRWLGVSASLSRADAASELVLDARARSGLSPPGPWRGHGRATRLGGGLVRPGPCGRRASRRRLGSRVRAARERLRPIGSRGLVPDDPQGGRSARGQEPCGAAARDAGRACLKRRSRPIPPFPSREPPPARTTCVPRSPPGGTGPSLFETNQPLRPGDPGGSGAPTVIPGALRSSAGRGSRIPCRWSDAAGSWIPFPALRAAGDDSGAIRAPPEDDE